MATKEQHAHQWPVDPFHAGDRIRKAREYVGQDRQTFADTIGVHRETLARYEDTGRAKRSVLISIAWNTHVRLEWLETGALPWIAGDEPVEGPHSSVKERAFDQPILSILEYRERRLAVNG